MKWQKCLGLDGGDCDSLHRECRNATELYTLKWLTFYYMAFISTFFTRFLKNLYLERAEGKEKERERNIKVWLPLMHPHCPNRGPGPQPRHVPWLGIKPTTLWFAGQHSIHWATPARATSTFFKLMQFVVCFPWDSYLALYYMWELGSIYLRSLSGFCVCVCVCVCMFIFW